MENACIPPEFEKASTNKPNKKDKLKKGILLLFSGYKKTKAMYKYGFIFSKNKTLFNTSACSRSKKINKNTM
jgi:hypothetical protein